MFVWASKNSTGFFPGPKQTYSDPEFTIDNIVLDPKFVLLILAENLDVPSVCVDFAAVPRAPLRKAPLSLVWFPFHMAARCHEIPQR